MRKIFQEHRYVMNEGEWMGSYKWVNRGWFAVILGVLAIIGIFALSFLVAFI